MRRKFIASFFLITMSFLVVFQLPVFAYCLCKSDIIAAPCHCEHSEKACALENQKDEAFSSCLTISHDCNLVIDLNVDHFVSHTQTFDTSPPNILAIIPLVEFSVNLALNTNNSKLVPIRGSPPPSPDCPLYLKHSVFRL